MWLWVGIALGVFVLIVVVVAVYDVTQKDHAILRNFPVVGHFRYWLEAVGPELRQYIVAANDEERPFSRDQRRWVYASAKNENNTFGFGTDNDLERGSPHILIQHNTLGHKAGDFERKGEHDEAYPLPCTKVLGEARGRSGAFRPRSLVNISAMSFGSLSAAATEAINRGCYEAGCMQNTGEGGIAPHHLHGGRLMWQIGTGYFGCRAADGTFSLERFLETVAGNPVRAIEIKLSQGAKPGLGGILPGKKVTPEIAAIRGIPVGRTCMSPASHSAFACADSLLDFAEMLADRTGLPVGIKSAVGTLGFWEQLADLMAGGDRGLDFITIDGAEGGSGAAPLVFTDHVALPFKLGFPRVHGIFAQRGIEDQLVWIGSGKLGFPAPALLALALGCDMVNVAREAMLAIGCIQAQKCHTGHCPTGVATQSAWLTRGLDPTSKAARLANYVVTLRKELTRLAHACGFDHPANVPLDQLEIVTGHLRTTSATALFGQSWGTAST